MQANASSRICWYSTSVSVWAGATVIESPVCTPIGSTFSIEQMMTQLSARSRITSSSNSFQPAIDCSMRISPIGLAARPSAASRSELLGGRGDAGAPAAEDVGGADDHRQADLVDHVDGLVEAVRDAPTAARRGRSRPSPALNCSRSSAVAMASALAPIISGVPGTPIEAPAVQRPSPR